MSYFIAQVKVRLPRYFVCYRVNFMLPAFADFSRSSNDQNTAWAIDRRVLSAGGSIIEDFNIFKAGSLHFIMDSVTRPMVSLVLEAAKSTLGQRVT